MQIKKIIISLLILLPTIVLAQKKIERKIYLYGDVTNKINSNVLIHFLENDPDIDYNAIKIFTEKGINAISWNSLFLPGAEYSQEAYRKTLNKNNIRTIIEIEYTNVSFDNYSYVETTVNNTNDGIETSSQTSQTHFVNEDYVKNVSLKMNVLTIKNGFSKPSGVIIGEASCTFKSISTQRSITRKIIRRVVNGLEKEMAFN